MDLEDLFDRRHDKKRWNSHHDHDSHDNRHYKDYDYHYENKKQWHDEHEHERDHHYGHDRIRNILKMLQSHPHKNILIAGVVITGFIILIVAIIIIWAMFPLIMRAIYYVEKNGVQGVSDFLLQSLLKIWKGNG